MSKIKGTVKWYNKDKGYGFIKGKADNEDYFFHYTQLPEEGVRDGEEVTFEPVTTEKGTQAQQIEIDREPDE